jgi:hypothetical protein
MSHKTNVKRKTLLSSNSKLFSSKSAHKLLAGNKGIKNKFLGRFITLYYKTKGDLLYRVKRVQYKFNLLIKKIVWVIKKIVELVAVFIFFACIISICYFIIYLSVFFFVWVEDKTDTVIWWLIFLILLYQMVVVNTEATGPTETLEEDVEQEYLNEGPEGSFGETQIGYYFNTDLEIYYWYCTNPRYFDKIEYKIAKEEYERRLATYHIFLKQKNARSKGKEAGGAKAKGAQRKNASEGGDLQDCHNIYDHYFYNHFTKYLKSGIKEPISEENKEKAEFNKVEFERVPVAGLLAEPKVKYKRDAWDSDVWVAPENYPQDNEQRLFINAAERAKRQKAREQARKQAMAESNIIEKEDEYDKDWYETCYPQDNFFDAEEVFEAEFLDTLLAAPQVDTLKHFQVFEPHRYGSMRQLSLFRTPF